MCFSLLDKVSYECHFTSLLCYLGHVPIIPGVQGLMLNMKVVSPEMLCKQVESHSRHVRGRVSRPCSSGNKAVLCTTDTYAEE